MVDIEAFTERSTFIWIGIVISSPFSSDSRQQRAVAEGSVHVDLSVPVHLRYHYPATPSAQLPGDSGYATTLIHHPRILVRFTNDTIGSNEVFQVAMPSAELDSVVLTMPVGVAANARFVTYATFFVIVISTSFLAWSLLSTL